MPWPQLHHWKWSEGGEFPPLSNVLAAPIWAWEDYNNLRAKLKTPVPNPKVLESETAGYLTIDAAHRAVSDPAPSVSERCVA